MKLSKNISTIIGLGIILFIGTGCGSDSTDTVKKDVNNEINNGSQPKSDLSDIIKESNKTNIIDNPIENNISKDITPVAVGYSAEEGILIETKADGTKRAWVNTRGEDCLVYRPVQNNGVDISIGSKKHCESLNEKKYANITSWRLPTEDEVVYLMANAELNGTNKIIYPDDNPNCLFMATDTIHRYVYTTNYKDDQGAFTDEGKTIAGVRCVADQ